MPGLSHLTCNRFLVSEEISMAESNPLSTASSQLDAALAKKPELGDLVVEYLESIGVEYIFGVPGGAI